MNRLWLLLSISLSVAASVSAIAQPPPAKDAPPASATQDRDQDPDRIYGCELMTGPERMEHRSRMHGFATEQEREAYRLQHHAMMQQRAKERGVMLPDEPMPCGMAAQPRTGQETQEQDRQSPPPERRGD